MPDGEFRFRVKPSPDGKNWNVWWAEEGWNVGVVYSNQNFRSAVFMAHWLAMANGGRR